MKLSGLGTVSFREAAPRIAADVVFLSGSLFAAFSIYLATWVMLWRKYPDPERIRDAFSALYIQNVLLVVLLGLLVFTLAGFYTHTRAYRGRYKLLVVFNAVSLTFLLHAFLQFFILRLPPVPRGVTILAWLISLITIGGSRTFKGYVTRTYSIERKLSPGEKPVKKVLVIGGAGYIGSVLLRRLLQQGYRVRVLDSLLYGESSVQELLVNPNFELQRDDFRHVESVVKAVQGMDAVVHLGAIVGDPACQLDAKMTLDTNLASTAMIRDVCRGAGIQRLLFASTCSVYGASEHLLDELSALNPVSLYACTKIDAERTLLSKRVPGFEPTVLRLGTAFGMSYRPRFDLVVNLLAARAFVEKKITVFNKTQWRPFIHVDDIAEAFIACLQAHLSLVGGEIFNVGSYALNARLEDLSKLIREHVRDVEIEEIEKTADHRNYRVSFDKIHTILGFQCRRRLADGVAEIVSALQSGLIGDYKDPIHYNDKSLDRLNVRALQEQVEEILGESEKFLRTSVPGAVRSG